MLIPLGLVGSYAGYLVEQGNFHAVSDGHVYRSGQLNAEHLAFYIEKYGIKSILNLRGENKTSGWYQAESRTAETHGAIQYDYGISANHDLDDGNIDGILEVLRAAPKPLLIHCKAGSDRTGLIAALYLYQIEGRDARTASWELSILYGHFPYLWSTTDAMDRTFWRYVSNHAR